jgi:hypothetical protein
MIFVFISGERGIRVKKGGGKIRVKKGGGKDGGGLTDIKVPGSYPRSIELWREGGNQ